MTYMSMTYQAVQIATTSLMVAILIAGLVIALRRWHLGMAARLGASGFALLLLTMAIVPVFVQFLQPLLFKGDGAEDILWRSTVMQAFLAVPNLAGMVLIVLGLRTALQQVARLTNGPAVDR